MTRAIDRRDGLSWYYATVVVRIDVAGDERVVIHKNTFLVRALHDDDAYARAIELGREHERDDINPAGKAVRIRFLGLHALGRIYDELEHGAELFWDRPRLEPLLKRLLP